MAWASVHASLYILVPIQLAVKRLQGASVLESGQFYDGHLATCPRRCLWMVLVALDAGGRWCKPIYEGMVCSCRVSWSWDKLLHVNVDPTEESPAIVSFCTGIRGIERGLERAIGAIRTVCFVEIEAFICENLACQMEAGLLDPAPIWTNLKTFPASIFRGHVEGIIGGYPCTPFSLAGLRKGEDDERHLWPFIRNHVESIGPLWCFFENVDDHLTMGFDTVYKDLRALGYQVEVGIYSAEEAGAPHERQRIFILAVHHSGIDRFKQKYAVPAGWDRPQRPGKVGNALFHRNGGRNHIREIRGHSLQAPGPGAVADPESPKCHVSGQSWGRWTRPADKGGILAYPSKQGLQEPGPGRKRKPGTKKGTGLDGGSEQRGRKLAYAKQSGSQGGHYEPQGGPQPNAGPVCSPVAYSDIWRSQSGLSAGMGRVQELDERWPAGPGPQYDWEHPRTLTRQAESEVGLSIDGYNFREDILRALGNSVVEQQCQIAWNDIIMNKFN